VNCRPLVPLHARPDRPKWQERTAAIALLETYIDAGKLKRSRLPIYKKIVDLSRDGAPHFSSNIAIARMTFEDYGLMRCENTVQAAKNELETARLLIIKRGAARRVGYNRIRRPAHETQASGPLATALGFRNSWLPGVVLCYRPRPLHLTLKDFTRNELLRVTHTQNTSYFVNDRDKRPRPPSNRFVDRSKKTYPQPKHAGRGGLLPDSGTETPEKDVATERWTASFSKSPVLPWRKTSKNG